MLFIPMPTLSPHINFNGNAEEAFLFYQSVFGGEFSKLIRFKDIATAEFPVSEKEANKIMHIELPIGPVALMGNDVPEMFGPTNENEHRSKIVIRAENKVEASQLFYKLSIDGVIEVPLDESTWGTFFGMFRDKFGIEWIVEC